MKIAPIRHINNIQYISKAKNNVKQQETSIEANKLDKMHFCAHYQTKEKAKELSIKELDEVQKLQEAAVSLTKEYALKLEAASEDMNRLKAIREDKIAEVSMLYKNNAQLTPDSRKIEIIGDTMREYDKDGKNVVRETLFDDSAYECEFKKGFFGKVTMKKTKAAKVIVIKEMNEDNSTDFITQGSYMKGYKKFSNGSEKYDEAVFLRDPFSVDKMRRYAKGFTRDENGNKSFMSTIYQEMSPNVPTIYRENERLDASFNVKADVQYYVAAPMFGTATETYCENYEENNGYVSYLKSVKTMLDNMLEYKEGYIEGAKNKKEWSKFYKREDEFSPWQSIVPEYGLL